MFRRLVLCLGAALVVLPAAPAMADGADYEQVVDLTFPTAPDAHFSHDYHDPRGGGTRVHKATDLMAPKGTPLYAAVAGEVCWITGIDEPEPSYGYMLRICGDDGRGYSYVHINNDTPGTDDGMGGPEHAYAPGIRRGAQVGRGQLVGWMGDSGNAESTVTHLHFEIHDENVTDPYGDHRIDPYHSLVAALDRGDVADGSVVATDRVVRIFGADRVGTAVAMSARRFAHADHAIIAPAESPAEAIVAGPLAGVLDAPVLTTWSSVVDDRVLAELERLGVGGVTLVGDGLDAGLEGQLTDAGIDEVDRLAGDDRFGTAAAVAERVWELTADDQGNRNAVLALGDHPDPDRSWPDSLMAAYHGSLTGTPVLLVRPDELPAATAAALETVEGATIIGGAVAVPEEIATAVTGLVDGDLERLYGATRLETALAVTQAALDAGLVSVERVWAATGYNWPDAVTAGSTVAAAGDVLVLVNGQGPAGDSAVGAWLRGRAERIASGIVIGGDAAVTPAAADALAGRIT